MSRTPIFTGSAVALITPFTQGGKAVDFDALGKLIEMQIVQGTQAIVILGTTGEPATMTSDEKRAVVEFAIKKIDKRVKAIVGSGGNNTAAVIESSVWAQNAGADALLVVTPYYNKTTQAGLIKHYFAVADSVDLPIIAYNVPGRTGLNIQPATLAKLAEHKNIVAVKEASGNFDQINEIAAFCENNPDFTLYSGDDGLTLPMLSVGAKGVISVTANVIPSFMQELCEAYFKGDSEKARKMSNKLVPFAKACFVEVNPSPVKTCASLLGLCRSDLRMPLCELEPASLEKLKRAMDGFGLKY